ncbi:MAG: CAP domain-containing protein [Treponema sp.]|uniref:CAP domain-containing protein n=1 Tax=Treponema sp. TaxID=166 RepID=UPI0025E28D0A|nr:CAP domain-containing protein [Treponema sp.]MBQ9281492.1 CAP domain-containing protein [Treponema sp.]
MKKSFFPNLALILASMFFFSCATLDKLNEFSANMNKKSEESTSNKNLDADKWDIAMLDTARNADYLSTVEKDVILEMNKARTNPSLYAELYITPRTKKFDGKIYDDTLMTNEGVAVVNECISYMKKAKALPVLNPEKGLSLAARQHSSTQGETNQTGHTGVDGSTPFTRIEKYGTYKTAGENISYGSMSGRDIVVQLLIDDGVSSRGHRKNIMNKDFSSSGVGFTKKHKTYGSVCVITYAGGYSEK